MAVALLATLIATLAIQQLVPKDAVVPALVTLLFAVSAPIAGFALLCHRNSLRLMWFDLAGGLAFIGVVVSVFIEPEQLVRLFVASGQPE